MTMQVLSTEGLPGGAGGVADTLGKAVGELQRLKVSFVAGANTNVNIPVTGILTEDTIVNVVEYASRQVKEAVVSGRPRRRTSRSRGSRWETSSSR